MSLPGSGPSRAPRLGIRLPSGAGSVLPAIHNALEGGSGPSLPVAPSFSGAVKAGALPWIHNELEGGSGPSSPPAPSSGGGGGTGGDGGGGSSISDFFTGWLNSDPLYQQALRDITASAGNDKSSFAQNMNQLMIQYGITPDLAGAAGQLGLGGDALSGLLALMNPATAAAAAQNTKQGTSVLGRLIDANDLANQSIEGGEGARGMIQSGDNLFRLGQQNNAYNRNVYDALSRMLGSFSSGNASLTNALTGLYGDGGKLDTAMSQAWTRFIDAVQSGAVKLPAGVTLPTTAPAYTPPAGS